MKKIVVILMMIVSLSSLVFATEGFTEYQLAELLVTKGEAEQLFERSIYPVDVAITELTMEQLRVITTAKHHGLFEVTDMDQVVSFEDVRKHLSNYQVLKEELTKEVEVSTKPVESVSPVQVSVEEIESASQTDKYVFDYSNYLSDEIVKDMADNYFYYTKFGMFPTDMHEEYRYPFYDDHPEFNEYRRQITWIFAKYAMEHELFVGQTNSGVGLYESKSTYDFGNGSPLFGIHFLDGGWKVDGYEGTYHIAVELNNLHTVKFFYTNGDDLKEARQKLIEANYRTPYVVDAFKETLAWLFNDYEVRDMVFESMASEMDQHREIEYEYWLRENIYINGMLVHSGIGTNQVHYHFELKDVFK